MKAKPDCIPCMFRQALNTARFVTDDQAVHMRVFAELAGRIGGLDLNNTPAGLSQCVYEIVSMITGMPDPYAAQKAETNRVAQEIVPLIAGLIDACDDRLDAVLHVAAAGNMIDLGIGHEFDLRTDMKGVFARDFAIGDIEDFRGELVSGRKALYVGDNAGEIVFDKFLVSHMLDAGMNVTFTVKSGPIINDATMHDAEETGMTDLVSVIETGSNDIGVNWRNVSDEFRRAFESADVIVAKGHGNFETCNDRPENIYMLLKAKCAMVADELGVRVGDIVFKHYAAGSPHFLP